MNKKNYISMHFFFLLQDRIIQDVVSGVFEDRTVLTIAVSIISGVASHWWGIWFLSRGVRNSRWIKENLKNDE